MLEALNDEDIRQLCRKRLETAEQWLRRLVHDKLSVISPDYMNAKNNNGDWIIKRSISKDVNRRINSDPNRYGRSVDALLLDELISIICNPSLYSIFRNALFETYPNGREEARTFLNRLIDPRNKLSHANQISLRQAEQVMCYTGDIISSLKDYYAKMGKFLEYNVPLIIKISDSHGHQFERQQLSPVHDGGIMYDARKDPPLYPGDILTVEIEVDSSFSGNDYVIRWASTKPLGDIDTNSHRIVVPITNAIVSQEWNLQCYVTSKKDWHRMSMGCDDFLFIVYKVLPPI